MLLTLESPEITIWIGVERLRSDNLRDCIITFTISEKSIAVEKDFLVDHRLSTSVNTLVNVIVTRQECLHFLTRFLP